MTLPIDTRLLQAQPNKYRAPTIAERKAEAIAAEKTAGLLTRVAGVLRLLSPLFPARRSSSL